MNPVEKKLFRVVCNLSIYPAFYVEATDILEATKKSKEIVEWYASDKTVVTISTVDTPFLDLEEENEK